MGSITISETKRLFSTALGLAVFTIIYNIAEGLISTYLGFEDESLALFGFGTDSFIEVISGLGIVHMILRIRKNPDSSRDDFERTALRGTGVAFYLLVAGLVTTSLYNLWTAHKPITTFWGVVISLVSILLVSSGIYAIFEIGYIDSLGTLGLSYFAFKEGKECFEKARSDIHCSCD